MSLLKALEEAGITKEEYETVLKIREPINNGRSVEIHPAKEGIKVYDVSKKIIK